jgi:casein kinase 1
MQPIAPMTVNGRPGNTAANSQQMGEADYGNEAKGGNGFLKLISCGMCR